MILESIVTTVSESGQINLAPMGPTVDELIRQITLKPFRSSRTYANLKPSDSRFSGKAVVHVTDDVLLFARAAMGDIDAEEVKSLVTSIGDDGMFRLKDTHRWFSVSAEGFTEDDLRATVKCRITDSGVVQPFFGFNRAKHAVIEAAILATRTHLIPAHEILAQRDRLQIQVEKTASDRERQAFDFLIRTIDKKIAQGGSGNG